MKNKLLVPDIGDFEKVEIIEILVKTGDNIKKNERSSKTGYNVSVLLNNFDNCNQ